jgi:hypothetical protein
MEIVGPQSTVFLEKEKYLKKKKKERKKSMTLFWQSSEVSKFLVCFFMYCTCVGYMMVLTNEHSTLIKPGDT